MRVVAAFACIVMLICIGALSGHAKKSVAPAAEAVSLFAWGSETESTRTSVKPRVRRPRSPCTENGECSHARSSATHERSTATENEAHQAWVETKDSTDITVLKAFIDHYRGSFYAILAQKRLDELMKDQVAVVALPEAPCGGGSARFALLSRRAAQPLSSAEECALKPKDAFKECDKCPEMVVVPAGRFTMGSPESEGHPQMEDPQHAVFIERAFAAGKFHVTVDQFAAFVTETGYDAGSKCRTLEGGKFDAREARSWRYPGFAQDGSHPAVCLNWNDAKVYVAWLSSKTHKPYRLLTEAEWEYATRAGTTTEYYFGDNEKDLCRYGNGADQTAEILGIDNRGFAPCSDGYAHTSPVGRFLPNAFGLYDMLGNASEWLEDCWNENYKGAPSDGAAWVSGECGRRVLRGGSWLNGPGSLRAAFRISSTLDGRFNYVGFRLRRTLAP